MSRLIWVDSLKGILILLVVLGHCIATNIGNDSANKDYLWCLIYSFHMPAFIAVSGYLSYRKEAVPNKNLSTVFMRRFMQLMVPFFAWSAIFYLVSENSLNSYYHCILAPNETYWFLWALFFIVVLFSLANFVSSKILWLKGREEILLCLICLICAGTLVALSDIRILGIQYILYYFIFYTLGYFINKFNIVASNKWVIIMLGIVWFVLGSYWRPHELPPFLYQYFGNSSAIRYVYKFVVALVAVVFIFSAAPALLNRHNALNNTLCAIGAISLGIYAFHMIILNSLVKSVASLIDDPKLITICSFVILSIVSFVAVYFLGRWKWTNRILLGKY